MKVFAERLKELRLEQGLTTRDLAKAVDVSVAAISRWENNLRIPNIENLVAICRVFKVDPNFMLGFSDF